MRGDFLRIIFDIIVLIVLALLIYYIIMVFIGLAMGNEVKYIGYLNTIADDINNGMNGEVFINNYDYNYVFVLTNNNGWYLQLYHCLPPNQVVGFLSVKVAYWNVSTINTNNGNIVVFAPALMYCKLVKQRLLDVNQININIQGLNDEAGLLVYSSDEYLQIFQILISIADSFFSIVSQASPSMFLAILNDTTITCDSGGCTYTSSSTGESGSIYCAPNPHINTNKYNLPYNPSDCVELSGFPRNRQVVLSNFVGKIIDSATLGGLIREIYGIDFPVLYFAGSLPPTVMYIDISSNTQSRTANINIYIGETVS